MRHASQGREEVFDCAVVIELAVGAIGHGVSVADPDRTADRRKGSSARRRTIDTCNHRGSIVGTLTWPRTRPFLDPL